jgi:hypothetical protein
MDASLGSMRALVNAQGYHLLTLFARVRGGPSGNRQCTARVSTSTHKELRRVPPEPLPGVAVAISPGIPIVSSFGRQDPKNNRMTQIVYYPRPVCPKCGSPLMRAYKSTDLGDGDCSRHSVCKACGEKFILVLSVPEQPDSHFLPTVGSASAKCC